MCLKISIVILVLTFANAIICSNLTDICGHNIHDHNLDEQWRIIGGINSNSSEWPWQVALRRVMDMGDHHFVLGDCGGAVISKEWVLTAAHCVHNYPQTSSYLVYLGYSNLDKPSGNELMLGVSKIIEHELFNYEEKSYDLALVRLNETLDFETKHKNLRPVCIPDLHNEPLDQCFATGYGYKDTDGKNDDKSLMKVSEPIYNITHCEKLMENINTERNICAGGTAKEGFGTCSGDSGGPLQCLSKDGKWYQIGITSWGLPCAHADVPDVFTRVAFYHDWIAKNIQ